MYYAERTTRSSFVLGYACADEAALDAAVRTMVDALRE
jgi:DNA-binding transcriptional MocR family regulator